MPATILPLKSAPEQKYVSAAPDVRPSERAGVRTLGVRVEAALTFGPRARRVLTRALSAIPPFEAHRVPTLTGRTLALLLLSCPRVMACACRIRAGLVISQRILSRALLLPLYSMIK